MMKREAVQAAVLEMRKAQEKAARCIDSASRAIDPQYTAELMHAIHQAQDSLSAARRALNNASGTAGMLAQQLLDLLPEEKAA
jgi:hypothetical protein